MSNYDINDPTQVDIMNAMFDGYSEDDWDRYIELAKEKRLGYDNVGKLITAKKKAGLSKYLSSKQVSNMLSLVDKLEEMKADDEKNGKTAELLESDDFEMPVSHVTLRVAWHDNKWNGAICNDPANNTYCNGFNSLLSERIRKRKEDNIEKELEHHSKFLKDIDYLPPCFWSINLFGSDEIKIEHDNPAADSLTHIHELLPEKSMLTWPFSVSFTRTRKEQTESGAYPKNLEEVRIPRFNAKMHEGKSIAFMYAKFSNPITEEDQQYLVIGAGIINSKQNVSDIKHFGPASEIQKIKERPKSNFKYRNFPSINWAMRFSFDDYSTVRMPYHEYLNEADKLKGKDKEEFLDNIKVAISEPELEWCFKYVAMDIGDDEAIYILTKMRKALIMCKDDGVVPRKEMLDRIDKIDQMLQFAWSSRSYFPGFVNLSRALLNMQDEPKFDLETFYLDFKEDISPEADKEMLSILKDPSKHPLSKKYSHQIAELVERLNQVRLTTEQFLLLSMLNLRPFQFQRILDGKLVLPDTWIKDFDSNVKRSHDLADIIGNPYLLCEDYEFFTSSHDNVYGEELDLPIDIFKIDIAYFPHSRFSKRIDLQRRMEFIDKRRIRALVIRHLLTLEQTGDCFADAAKLQAAVTTYPLFYEIGSEYKLPESFFYPIEADFANHFTAYPQKLVLVEENETMYYYLSVVYDAKVNIKQKINKLLRAHSHKEQYTDLDDYINSSISSLKKTIGDEFNAECFREEREALYKNLFAKRFFVVSGSAGSGKSFEILNIIRHLEQNCGQKYLLLAPTGKAALRLSNDVNFKNIKANTIDKFIVDVKNRKISAAEIRDYKNVIIDETSMVDLLKLNSILNLFNFDEPSFKRLILIGDPNQLPAIGYGRVLEDILSFLRTSTTYNSNYVQLETNCRSELKNNDVLKLAEAFKQKGEFDPLILSKFKNQDYIISEGFKTRYWSSKNDLYKQIEEEFDLLTSQEGLNGASHERLYQILGLSKDGEIMSNKMNIENFQILTPYCSLESGATKINDLVQLKLKKNLKLEFRKNQYKKSDKLIRTKNYYEKNNLLLSNGTMGLIKDSGDETFYYESADGVSEISFNDIRRNEQEFFELAYAITVHKSQGSGFNHLFFVLPARYGLLSKEMLYTALTRTKKTITLFLQVDEEKNRGVLELAQGRSFSGSRLTSLMLDKPFRYYDLEPEPGIFIESRIELLIYHLLMIKRDELGIDKFNFSYERKPIVGGNEINIKTDFTILFNGNVWYWEHLGLIGQRKYTWTWQNLKKKTYQDAGIWDNIITTDETRGINPSKIQKIIDLIICNKVTSEDKFNQYSNHHFYLK